MKRVIVDYSKLTNEILDLLLEKFPDGEGYDDSDIISFRNAKNELIEAVEVRTEDTIYLVKVSTKLANRLERLDEDDEDDDLDGIVEPIDAKAISLDDDDVENDDDDDDKKKSKKKKSKKNDDEDDDDDDDDDNDDDDEDFDDDDDDDDDDDED